MGTNETGAREPWISAVFSYNNSNGETLLSRYVLSLLSPHHMGRFLSPIFSLLVQNNLRTGEIVFFCYEFEIAL